MQSEKSRKKEGKKKKKQDMDMDIDMDMDMNARIGIAPPAFYRRCHPPSACLEYSR